MNSASAFHSIYATKNETDDTQTVLHEGNESGKLSFSRNKWEPIETNTKPNGAFSNHPEWHNLIDL